MSIARTALALSLQFADARHRAQLPRHLVQRCLCAALDAPAQITVRIVDADEGRALNLAHRGKDYATNVLTFAYAARPEVLADLVLCAPVVEAEAKAQRIPVADHYAHLLVHGALHAQGLDHEVESEAVAMEAVESRLMQALGYADPYAVRATPKRARAAR
jgi:probable rRNA maturation factor